MADIVIINPRFEISMLGYEHAMPFLGKKAMSPAGALALLAAVTPPNHVATLIDENIEPIDFDRCARADIVGVTGIIVQRARMMEIISELKRRGVFVVVGGAFATVDDKYFEGLADVVFVGEAEESWPRFLAEWAEGRHRPRYEQAENTDLTALPVPRWDLLKMGSYVCGNMQFSRGCPFVCEFCNTTVFFGRHPRVKKVPQVLAELDALRAQRVENIFVMDDNLIAGKKAIKEVLRAVAAWQKLNDYPISFMCQVSLDLADDPEMMRLMVDANVFLVFVGIESPNQESLRETKKLHNLRKGGTIVEKVHAIQHAGMEVSAGMILGFDHDDIGIFDAHRRFITEARISDTYINLLVALPGTPLYARLQREGRFDAAARYDTNVIPLRMTGEALRHGANALAHDLYEVTNYFDRLDSLYLDAELAVGRARQNHLARHPLLRLKANAISLIQAGAVLVSLLWKVEEPELAHEYRRRMWRALTRRGDPTVLRIYAVKCAVHYHTHLMSRQQEHIYLSLQWEHPSHRSSARSSS